MIENIEQLGLDQQEELQNHQLSRDRTRRQIRAPDRYGFAEYISFALTVARDIEGVEPMSYKETLSDKNSFKWVEAMNDEMESLKKNQTWVLVEKPVGQINWMQVAL
ncbi:hypothetical protein TorRG33x02_186740 [Trema orientale]|uniref:Uncharacterized protein n=1 Tax=Trema orientale TaxID=63057 RepID=A0A2P5EJ26_TREOI|nr:hypothetical protein TorRG33x02_186740 [Trema orientale]